MARWRRRIIIIAVVAILAAGTLWAIFTRMLYHRPDFYTAAVSASASEMDTAGVELEKNLLTLHNQVRRGGQWQVRLNDLEVNGWLAADLPSKLPNLLPADIANPCVSFRGQAITLAFRYADERWDVIVSARLSVSATNESNQIKVRIDRLRAGAIPLPLTRVMEQASDACRDSGIRLRWTEEQGRPVALIRLELPSPHGVKRDVVLEQITVEDGQLVLSGTSQ